MKANVLISLFFVFLTFSCSNPFTQNPSNKIGDFSVIVIDSCEYIFTDVVYKDMNRAFVFSHKGNCSFCEKRQAEQIEKMCSVSKFSVDEQ